MEVEKKEKAVQRCCNTECVSKSRNFTLAPVSTLKFYGVDSTNCRKYVCEVCLQSFVDHKQDMVNWALEKKPLFDFKLPDRKETIVITDSDDEQTDENDDIMCDDAPMIIADDLKEVVLDVFEKLDLKKQCENNANLLIDNMTNLTAGIKSEIADLDELQIRVDQLRKDFYAAFKLPRYVRAINRNNNDRLEVAPIEIIDSIPYEPPENTGTIPKLVVQRKSLPPYGLKSPPRIGTGPGVAMKKVTQVRRNTFDALTHSEDNPHTDIVALGTVPTANPSTLPPTGILERPKLKPGDQVYALRQHIFGMWTKAKLLAILENPDSVQYKIKYESSYRKGVSIKNLYGKNIAYNTPSKTRIPVGTRVIAIFRDDDTTPVKKMGYKESYYCGVVAEDPKSMNNFRYLIFFDDGYAQYIQHEKILVVYEASPNVWEDIHPDSREFIRKYLEDFPERPMVRLNAGQILRTEWNGKWWVARVLEVDASLVHLHFDADGRTEWIYRGSTRLGPLYKELANANRSHTLGNFKRFRGPGTASLKRLNLPYVEYTRGSEMDIEQLHLKAILTISDDKASINKEVLDTKVKNEASPANPPVVRAVARKSTATQRKAEETKFEYLVPCHDDRMVKCVKQLDVQLKPYKSHDCNFRCLEDYPYPQDCTKGENPLAKPLLCGWVRQIVRHRGGTKRVVLYVGPCSRRIRNLEELHTYLQETLSTMPIDLFDFDFWVSCLTECRPVNPLSYIKDISYGKENVPIPAINWIDYSYPDFVEYTTSRIPTSGVRLNLDPSFLVCCDCEDDCQNKDKCACWQLTIQGTRCSTSGQVDPTVGYMYKRLPEQVGTGIYECNSRCKCKETCLNRVAQLPLQQRLQVFRTTNRGWGVQCLNDIPQGAFICVYVGHLLTEQGANEDGKAYGDEYLAELDLIEVVERMKEGYESDVMEDSESAEEPPEVPNKQRESPALKPTESSSKVDESSDNKSDEDNAEDDDDEETEGIRWRKNKNSYDVDEDFKASHRLSMNTNEMSIRSRLRRRTNKSDDSSDTSKSEDTITPKRSCRREASKKETSMDSIKDSSLSEDEEEVVRTPSRFTATQPKLPSTNKSNHKPKFHSVREFYGAGEYCYIMDAKSIGNVGRYLNHSCTPNVFVQNVFVDSHDLRFPWVAFFALTYIAAGTELTWDYNYDVGSVPGKVMYCHCGSRDCRGRLL